MEKYGPEKINFYEVASFNVEDEVFACRASICKCLHACVLH